MVVYITIALFLTVISVFIYIVMTAESTEKKLEEQNDAHFEHGTYCDLHSRDMGKHIHNDHAIKRNKL